MATESKVSAVAAFACSVESFYAGLIPSAGRCQGGEEEPSLGGQLLYAGELSEQHRALVVAANIGGAATLAATTDVAAQKAAIRDGVIDFLVTSLDEALRILKNEVRKHETVAVCVAAAPEVVEVEMGARGVVPDLIFGFGRNAGDGASTDQHGFARYAKAIEPLSKGDGEAMLIWSVAAAPLRWLPRIDALALDCLDHEAWEARRWLRKAPRFLGGMTKSVRVLRCEPAAAIAFVAKVELAMMSRELGVPVEIELARRGMSERFRFTAEMAPPCTN